MEVAIMKADIKPTLDRIGVESRETTLGGRFFNLDNLEAWQLKDIITSMDANIWRLKEEVSRLKELQKENIAEIAVSFDGELVNFKGGTWHLAEFEDVDGVKTNADDIWLGLPMNIVPSKTTVIRIHVKKGDVSLTSESNIDGNELNNFTEFRYEKHSIKLS